MLHFRVVRTHRRVEDLRLGDAAAASELMGNVHKHVYEPQTGHADVAGWSAGRQVVFWQAARCPRVRLWKLSRHAGQADGSTGGWSNGAAAAETFDREISLPTNRNALQLFLYVL